MQTFTPFSPSIQFARHHDFSGYFEQELEFRERCDFPPFKHAVLITVRSEHEARGKFSAETLARRLRELGHEVNVSNSRDPETLADLANETGATAVWAAVDEVPGPTAVVERPSAVAAAPAATVIESVVLVAVS